MTESEISYKIRGAIYAVYNTLGPGLLESVYQEALAYQLRKDGLVVKEQAPIPIIYDGHCLGDDLKLDMLVNDTVIIELKSVSEMKALFFKQTLTYLKLSHKHLGILVNFNTDNINTSIHRILNGYL
jgi:GxxExxY protein